MRRPPLPHLAAVRRACSMGTNEDYPERDLKSYVLSDLMEGKKGMVKKAERLTHSREKQLFLPEWDKLCLSQEQQIERTVSAQRTGQIASL